MTETIEFEGESFHIAERVAAMSLMRFAKVAQSGATTTSMAGLAAQHDLIEQCIHPDDWPRFQAHAEKVRANGDQLLTVVQDVLKALAERPTGRPSDSSDGPRTIEPSSTDDSSLPGTDAVIHRLNEKGRPDLALMVYKRQQSIA